jgi:hypothetical protein
MKKTLAALLAVATVAAFSVTPASAQRGVGAAIAGGLIGGAIVGGAIASQAGPPPAYVEGPPCRWERQRWWDGYEWRYRRIQVCD